MATQFIMLAYWDRLQRERRYSGMAEITELIETAKFTVLSTIHKW